MACVIRHAYVAATRACPWKAPTLTHHFSHSIIRENKPSLSRSSFFQRVSSNNHFPHRSTITDPHVVVHKLCEQILDVGIVIMMLSRMCRWNDWMSLYVRFKFTVVGKSRKGK
ncbi:hypothetical protein LR48_Vigan10g149100 [Vigna angularis]|uniref:Uncharacterized protein n=1 Tax=Phaseolus angularis TaxID=3914 RepID=A0A0L9VLJ2_PHAAN|nr:hypothetical protein LR48_Vigan10g149100 [Vigna angularis]